MQLIIMLRLICSLSGITVLSHLPPYPVALTFSAVLARPQNISSSLPGRLASHLQWCHAVCSLMNFLLAAGMERPCVNMTSSLHILSGWILIIFKYKNLCLRDETSVSTAQVGSPKISSRESELEVSRCLFLWCCSCPDVFDLQRNPSELIAPDRFWDQIQESQIALNVIIV